MRFLWRWYLKLSGWETDLVFPYHHVRKFVIIVGPHTSNWDFVVGLAYRQILRLNDTRFLGKAELFKPPFGALFRTLGGIPVNRGQRRDLVNEVIALFQAHHTFALALSPEGTRSRVEKLKTGFYFIARGAQVPVVMVGLDWRNKTLRFETFVPEDLHRDFERIAAFYRTVQGRHPHHGLMHL